MNGGETDNAPAPDDAPISRGGRGSLAAVFDALADPHRARGAASVFCTALHKGTIDIFGIDYQLARREATLLSKSDKPRLKAAGLKLLAAMANHDRQMLEAADKAHRLDSGGATENSVHYVQFVAGVKPDDY